MLVCSSNASFASCTMNVPGGQVLALSGDTCYVTGPYATTADGAIAGQATGLNALITGPSARTVTFSTTGVSANGLQADTGGQITLTEGTVTTTGNGSQGLSVGGVGSTLQASGVSVTTSGATNSDTGNRAYAVLASSGGQITITGSSAATTGDSSYVAGIIAGGTLNLERDNHFGYRSGLGRTVHQRNRRHAQRYGCNHYDQRRRGSQHRL